MKIIVIGDIHGRTCWHDIVKKNPDADKIIFLGDYVSTHENIQHDQQCDNLFNILMFKQKNPDKVVLLRGNHDMQHLGYHWAECSGFDKSVADFMQRPDIKKMFLELTQWVYIDNDIVYSHAGVSEVWMSNLKIDSVNNINNIEPSENFGFWPCKLSDYTGDSVTQPCTWIRPWTLFFRSFGNYTYIVGHTHHDHIFNVKDEVIQSYKASYHDEINTLSEDTINYMKSLNDIWLCDTLPNEYLQIIDGNISAVKL